MWFIEIFWYMKHYSRKNLPVLVVVHLVNMHTYLTWPLWNLSRETFQSNLMQCKPFNHIYIYFIFFIYIFRAQSPHHGRTLLWAKWTDSAERVVVRTSGYPSSTYLNDELLTAKTCGRTFICAGRVLWTLMDTLPSRDQIPKCSWWAKKKLGGRKTTLLSAWDVFKRESAGGSISTLDRTVWSCVCQPGWQSVWDGEAWVGNLKKKHVCAFYCEAGHCTDGLYHVCVVKPLWQLRKVQRNQKVELLSGPRPWPLCRNKALVETLDLMQFHLFDLNC